MTYPLIGNYGRLVEDDQSARPWLRGARRRQRDGRGRRRRPPARVAAARPTASRRSPASTPGRWPATSGRTAACAGSSRSRASSTDDGARPRPRAPFRAGRTRTSSARSRRRSITDVGRPEEGGPLVAIVDYGLKANIVRSLRRRGARVRVLPHTISTAVALAPDIDGVILSPGPGDPARLEGPVALARAVIDDGRPLLGICLGHQIVARAAGAETRRLRFGHHGANHPVQDVDLGLVQVTAQNHEVQVVGDSLPAGGGFQVSQVNLNDGSVEGLRHATMPIETVQYHPEGAPGPLDALAVFDRFVAACRAAGDDAAGSPRRS